MLRHAPSVMCCKSCVTCHLRCIAYFLEAILIKTVFMLKPLEARRKKTFGDATATVTARGFWIDTVNITFF